MSAYPTCPEHGVLKPCPHCAPAKHVVTGSSTYTGLRACTDVGKGERLVSCEVCGELRSDTKKHGEKAKTYWGWP